MTSKVIRTGRTLVLDIYEVWAYAAHNTSLNLQRKEKSTPRLPLTDLLGVTLPPVGLNNCWSCLKNVPPFPRPRQSGWNEIELSLNFQDAE